MSLIVGDVKQSIYRWRNSDWSILNNLEKEFPNYPIEMNSLKINRRSERRVIEFNNELFSIAAGCISEQYTKELGESGEELIRAYSDVKQEILSEKPKSGYVEVRMIEKGDDAFEKQVYEQLLDTLDTLLNVKGVVPSDITILVRRNREIAPIAKLFGERFPDYSITSDEAYLLSNSVALNIVVSALRYICSSEDKLNLFFLVTRYSSVVRKTNIDVSQFTTAEYMQSFLPDGFIQNIESLRKKPLYELLEQLIVQLEVFKIEGEEAYIYSFLDYASRFLKENSADIEEFLSYWDEELSEKAIPAGESDGVRILSIHKSKGLEFHTVIIPFCTWELVGGVHKNILWCKPKLEPFNSISLLPIDWQSSMLESIYKAEYNHEYLYQLVDNLNLLYVACTRAGKNLIIFSDANGGRGDTISKRFPAMLENINLDGAVYDRQNKRFTYGEIVASYEKDKNKSDNPFIAIPQIHIQGFVSYDNKLTFRQSRNFMRFIATEKSERKTLEYIARGELLHELLSKLRTGKELTRQLKKMRLKGIIATDAEFFNIEKLIKKALDNPKAFEWFNGKYKLYNECTILYNEKNEEMSRRPDRVMVCGDEAIIVDFKFGIPKLEYQDQVRKYMSLLSQLGYNKVKGYLWYVYNNKIEEVYA